MSDEITDANISDMAKSPKRVTTEEGTMVERSIQDILAAEKFLGAKEGLEAGPPYGLRIAKMKFPGSTG